MFLETRATRWTYFGECWGEHHPGRWWRGQEACSTPHRCGWRAEGDGEWYESSCCREQRCRQAQEFRQRGTRERQRGRRERRHQHAGRSCPCGGDDGHDRRGKRDQPWKSGCTKCKLARWTAQRRWLRLGAQNAASKVGDAESSAQTRADSRLRVLGTASLAAGLAASSHFDGLVGFGWKVWYSLRR